MYTVSITSVSNESATRQQLQRKLLFDGQENGNTSVRKCVPWSFRPAVGRSHPDPVNGMGIPAPFFKRFLAFGQRQLFEQWAVRVSRRAIICSLLLLEELSVIT